MMIYLTYDIATGHDMTTINVLSEASLEMLLNGTENFGRPPAYVALFLALREKQPTASKCHRKCSAFGPKIIILAWQ